MILETKRLRLRPWKESDAEALYTYARDEQVGPVAGWPVHTSVENSREIIQNVLAKEGTYAITLKEDDQAIGSIGLMGPQDSNLAIKDNEAEIGYWIGVPFWGQGLVPEAERELMRYAFEDLHKAALWCAHFEGNEKSKKAMLKCGFHFHHTEEEKEWKLIQKVLVEHVYIITKEEWKSLR